MHKLKKYLNTIIPYINFSIIGISYIFIVSYFSEKLAAIPIDNILINITRYIVIIVVLIIMLKIGIKFIFKYFNPFGEIIYYKFVKKDGKKINKEILTMVILGILINRNVINSIEYDLIRSLLRSCLLITVLVIYVRYLKTKFNKN